ncbi:MAG: helix-turn-helix domain-containing protein [bacterium]|nr:helix-turn-helix domain-containing protein [bacterium]
MKLGDILKELLDLHDMTQKQLAEELALSPSALGNYVQGTREPDYNTLIKIADFFQVSTDYLLNHSAKTNASLKEISHREELLLHIYRSLTEDQQDFYLEQGQIFLRQNRKKDPSLLPRAQKGNREVS